MRICSTTVIALCLPMLSAKYFFSQVRIMPMYIQISPLRGGGYLQPVGKHIRLGANVYTWQYNSAKHTIKTLDGKLAWDVWDPKRVQQKIVLHKPNQSINQQFKFVYSSGATVAQIVNQQKDGRTVKMAMDKRKVLVFGSNKRQQWLPYFMKNIPWVQPPKPQGRQRATSNLEIYGKQFRAKIQKDGNYLEGRIVGVVGSHTFNKKAFEDELFELAQAYVQKHKQKQTELKKWEIEKPFAWMYGSAHMTLDAKYSDALGKDFNLTFGKPYHFQTTTSRWIVLPVEHTFPEYTCAYECHVSIGQERIY
jgi:hypothetical protein